MGFNKAELFQRSVGNKRKKLDGRAFKALFKRQRIKEDGKLEGPDNLSRMCNSNGLVISSNSVGEGEAVSDECCKGLNGNLRHLNSDKAAGGDLQKSIGNLRTDSEILGNNVTVDFNYVDVIADSPKPLSADTLTDTRTDSGTRKSFAGADRLPTGCPITGNTITSKSGSADCNVRTQHLDPAIGELTEVQGTQVTALKEGHSTITTSNLIDSLPMDSISTNDAPNSIPGQNSYGAEVGTGESEEIFLSLSEHNNRHNFLRVELGRLCQILKLSVDVTHRVREFLEYVIQNHNLSSDAPAVMHAFLLSVCWIATRISKQKVDKKDSFDLAKKLLNYECTEEQVSSVYSKMQPLKLTYLQSSENATDLGKHCMLMDENSIKESSRIIDGAPMFSLSTERNAKVEMKKNIEIILKQKLGMDFKAAGSEIHDKIKKIWKKCEKRIKKFVRKQEEEVQGLLRTWEEEKVNLEKDHKLESVVTRCIHGQGSVRNFKLKMLDDKFTKKMEEHNFLTMVQLNSLKEKQLAARNEEGQKAADWLAEAIACASKHDTVHASGSFGFQSDNRPKCTESGTHIMDIDPENVVTMFQEQAEDPNPSINLCSQGTDVAPSDTSLIAPAEIADSGCPLETVSDTETFISSTELGVMSLERPQETFAGQSNQLFQSCNSTEEIDAANLTDRGEPITEKIQAVEMFEEGPTELSKPVSDDIVLHGDPVESNNSSEIGDSNGLPNTEVNHRSEPCHSSISSLPFPGQPVEQSEEMLAVPHHLGLSKQHVTQIEIHQVASAKLDDGDTPAAEIQSTCQTEIATSEPGDTPTLVQSNHTVPITGNSEQPNRLSADASLVCIEYQPQETEHQTRDNGTSFSHQFVSECGENVHHNHLDLGQASRISHEQNGESVSFPDNTVISDAVSTTELPNLSSAQSGTDVGHFHGLRNSDAEITRSTCVQVSQNEVHQMTPAELKKLDTPAVEIKNTSQTEVASDAVTFVPSNHAVPVTGNYVQLHNLSVDTSLVCNQSLPNVIEHQNGDQVANFSQTVEAGQTDESSHEFVSQRSENLDHDHQYMGQSSRISQELTVEVSVRSSDNPVMAQAASTTELPNHYVPHLGIDTGHLRGPSHLLVHSTQLATSWNSTPSVVAEPLQYELENLLKEADWLEKKHKDAVLQLKSDCERKIQEIINQIRALYDKKIQDAEANFRLKKNELEKNKNFVLMNTKLAEAFRSKLLSTPLLLPQRFTSSFTQHLHQPSLPPPIRISPLASANRPPSQQNRLHMPPPLRSSPVVVRNVTASPPILATQRAGPVLSGISARPHITAIRSSVPPHLQHFRLAAPPSMNPSRFSAMPQWHSQPIFPPRLVTTPQPAASPPPFPQLMPNQFCQNTPELRHGQPFHLNLSQSPIDLRRDMNRHAFMNRNLRPLADGDPTVGSLEPSNLVTLGNIQGNQTSSAVDTDIICLSE